MILTSTTKPDRFTPAWLCADGAPKPGAIVYLIRAGDVFDRGEFEAELAGPHRAGKIYSFELTEAERAGIEQLLAEDPDKDRVLALIDTEIEVDGLAGTALIAGLVDEAKVIAAEIPVADRQLLKQVRDVLAEHWAPYRDLLAQQARRREIAPIVALRRFLVGIENGPEFAVGPDGLVTKAVLGAIDPLEMMSAGNRAYSLLFGGGQRRPLAPPSPSDGDPATSNDAPSPAAGSSAKRRGRRTPASS